MPQVTKEDIKSRCETSAPDAVIDDWICLLNEKAGACLDASYSECEARILFTLAVCHFISQSEGGEVESERAANGSTIKYVTKEKNSGLGWGSTDFGRQILALDNTGCLSPILETGEFMIGTAGSDTLSDGNGTAFVL